MWLIVTLILFMVSSCLFAVAVALQFLSPVQSSGCKLECDRSRFGGQNIYFQPCFAQRQLQQTWKRYNAKFATCSSSNAEGVIFPRRFSCSDILPAHVHFWSSTSLGMILAWLQTSCEGGDEPKEKFQIHLRKRERNCAWQCRSTLLRGWNMVDVILLPGLESHNGSSSFLLALFLKGVCTIGSGSKIVWKGWLHPGINEGAKLLPATVPEPAKTSLQTVFQSAARTQRKWLASFRFRWDARIGALRIQEHVPLHVMQSKAHEWRSFKFTRFILFRLLIIVIFLLIIFFFSTFCSKCGPKNGTVWRSHFWDRWPLSVARLFIGTFRPPLLINMDETALGYHFAGLRGTILRQRADSSAAPLDRASLSDVRGHVSYLASICDDVTVQDLLPQVLLGNEHRFTKQVLHSMEGKCPASSPRTWITPYFVCQNFCMKNFCGENFSATVLMCHFVNWKYKSFVATNNFEFRCHLTCGVSTCNFTLDNLCAVSSLHVFSKFLVKQWFLQKDLWTILMNISSSTNAA